MGANSGYRNRYLIALLIASSLLFGGCPFGFGDFEPYEQEFCYTSASLVTSGNSIPEVQLQPANRVKCDGNVLSDIFLYTIIANVSNDKTGESISALNVDNCGLRGGGWSKLSQASVNTGGDEKLTFILCGKKASGKSGPRVLNFEWQGKAGLSSLGPGCPEELKTDLYGAVCGVVTTRLPDGSTSVQEECRSGSGTLGKYVERGGFYSAILGSSFTFCVPTQLDVPEADFEQTANFDYRCDNDGLCSYGEAQNGCGVDCASCEQRLTSYVSKSPNALRKPCQADANDFPDMSRNLDCKWCPKPYIPQPKVNPRVDYGESWNQASPYPYLLPQGSYSTNAVNDMAGCTNVTEGSPFNCGGCGWSDEITPESVAKKGLELTARFCMGVAGMAPPGLSRGLTPFCAEEGAGSNVWSCQSPASARGNSNIPWFKKYSGGVNPAFFYNVVDAGNGCYGAAIV